MEGMGTAKPETVDAVECETRALLFQQHSSLPVPRPSLSFQTGIRDFWKCLNFWKVLTVQSISPLLLKYSTTLVKAVFQNLVRCNGTGSLFTVFQRIFSYDTTFPRQPLLPNISISFRIHYFYSRFDWVVLMHSTHWVRVHWDGSDRGRAKKVLMPRIALSMLRSCLPVVCF